MKRNNPFPGVTPHPDRHGKIRYRFRKKGCKSCYIHGPYGSAEFEANYQAALVGKNISDRDPQQGTVDWLIADYMRSDKYRNLKNSYRKSLFYALGRFRNEYGTMRYAELTPTHVEKIMDKMAATPQAANTFHKLIVRLWGYAMTHHGLTAPMPTTGVKRYPDSQIGYHTWTAADIQQFEAYHGTESKAVLALRLSFYTGVARGDIINLGWQNIQGNRIQYSRQKTGQSVSLPLLPGLIEVLNIAPPGQMLFLLNHYGNPYTDETFGNWFQKCRKKAGLKQGSIHGLRKAGAVELAEAGGTEFEIMTYLAHKTPKEAARYVRAANRNILADSAIEKRKNVSNPIIRLDKYRSNSLKG
jgi:integrase